MKATAKAFLYFAVLFWAVKTNALNSDSLISMINLIKQCLKNPIIPLTAADWCSSAVWYQNQGDKDSKQNIGSLVGKFERKKPEMEQSTKVK